MLDSIFFADNPFNQVAEVRPSGTHGCGVFAKIPIAEGTVWWQARPQDALIIEQKQFEVLSGSAQAPLTKQFLDAILTYSYYPADLNQLVFILDGGRFTDHSFTPNSIDHPSKPQSTAIRDITRGEEITEDYSKFGRCPWASLYGDFAEVVWGRAA